MNLSAAVFFWFMVNKIALSEAQCKNLRALLEKFESAHAKELACLKSDVSGLTDEVKDLSLQIAELHARRANSFGWTVPYKSCANLGKVDGKGSK